jgi:hypothetical protein
MASATFTADSYQIVTEETAYVDGCPVLDKAPIAVAQGGVVSVLEITFRDDAGNPIDLTRFVCPAKQPLALQGSEGPAVGSGYLLLQGAPGIDCENESEGLGLGAGFKFQEITSIPPVVEASGTITDAKGGVVRVALPKDVWDHPGVWRVEAALVEEETGRPRITARTWLMVESSLFVSDPVQYPGPPTFQEVRMHLKDHMAENTLLDSVEWSTVELAMALSYPVRRWNESPPPVGLVTTHRFPFKLNWLDGTSAQLLEMASHHYRRNDLRYQAGGIDVADKAKEGSYLTASRLLMQRFNAWMHREKVKRNAYAWFGAVSSPYGAGASRYYSG